MTTSVFPGKIHALYPRCCSGCLFKYIDAQMIAKGRRKNKEGMNEGKKEEIREEGRRGQGGREDI